MDSAREECPVLLAAEQRAVWRDWRTDPVAGRAIAALVLARAASGCWPAWQPVLWAWCSKASLVPVHRATRVDPITVMR